MEDLTKTIFNLDQAALKSQSDNERYMKNALGAYGELFRQFAERSITKDGKLIPFRITIRSGNDINNRLEQSAFDLWCNNISHQVLENSICLKCCKSQDDQDILFTFTNPNDFY